MSLIKCEQVTYSYGADGEAPIAALHGVDLCIEPGSFVALVGRNGSGKSTLARCLNGLILPTSGRVLVEGLDTRAKETRLTIRSTVGMVLQNPENQFVMSTVEEEVAFGPENLGLPRAELVEKVSQVLKLTALSELRRVDPLHLSAGEKGRLAIAAMLALSPRCLVLDETTALMDGVARRETLQMAEQLCADGMAIVWVTHFMDEVVHADRVVALDHGRVAFEGAPVALFSEVGTCQALGLGLPPSAQVAQGLARRGMSMTGTPLTLEELIASLVPIWEAK